MNPASVTNWRGQGGWNVELESGAPAQRFVPAARPIDLLEEDAVAHRHSATAHPVAVLEVTEDAGRYLPLGLNAVPVAEAGVDQALAGMFGAIPAGWPHNPGMDEFLPGSRFGGAMPGDGVSDLYPTERVSDDAVATPAAETEAILNAFIALPHDEAYALPLSEGAEFLGETGGHVTFGGGDDPHWMLTLLPMPDEHIHDNHFGHPGLGLDPWS